MTGRIRRLGNYIVDHKEEIAVDAFFIANFALAAAVTGKYIDQLASHLPRIEYIIMPSCIYSISITALGAKLFKIV